MNVDTSISTDASSTGAADATSIGTSASTGGNGTDAAGSGTGNSGEAASQTGQAAAAMGQGGADAWSGELDHLEKQAWFTALPKETQQSVRDGMTTKWKNLEGGWNKKFQAVSEEKKGWEAEKKSLTEKMTTLEREGLLFKDLFGADNAEINAAFEKEKQELADKLAAADKELSELRGFKTKAETDAKAAYDAMVAKEAERMSAAYKDILADEKASDLFEKLVGAGIEEEEAASMTRGKFNIKPLVVPRAAQIASRGDSPGANDTAEYSGLSPAEMIARAASRAAKKFAP